MNCDELSDSEYALLINGCHECGGAFVEVHGRAPLKVECSLGHVHTYQTVFDEIFESVAKKAAEDIAAFEDRNFLGHIFSAGLPPIPLPSKGFQEAAHMFRVCGEALQRAYSHVVPFRVEVRVTDLYPQKERYSIILTMEAVTPNNRVLITKGRFPIHEGYPVVFLRSKALNSGEIMGCLEEELKGAMPAFTALRALAVV